MTDNNILRRILIFDDDADLRKLLLTYLGKMFERVQLEEYDPVARGAPAEDFDWSRYDVLILDYYLCLHSVTGLDILHTNRKNPDFPATIMLTGAGNEEVAVRALKSGVYDYLRKQNLDKQELQKSILNAFEKHKQAKKRLSELTHQGDAFNKAIFYQQLENKKGDPEFRDRVLVLIELDNHAEIEERAGIILRDNIIRHIAKHTYEIFKLGECHPNITRHGDYSIALLIDATDSRKTLEFNINGMINHLKKRPYKFSDKKFQYTVSIGVVLLPGQGQSADTIIEYARTACSVAARIEDNSFHIYDKDKDTLSKRDVAPGPKPQPVVSAVKPEIRSEIPAMPVQPLAPQADPLPPPVKPVLEIKPQQTVEVPVPVTPTVQKKPDAGPGIAKPAKKTIAELKAEAIKPKPPAVPVAVPAEAVKPVVPGQEEAGLNEAELDDSARRLKKAFDEKRVIQIFQPVISLMNEEMETGEEIHSVSLQHIDKDGSVKSAEQIKAQITLPSFQKFVDRWILREVIGRVTNTDKNQYTFIVNISDASIADANFFNWLRKLLTGLDSKNPGKFLALEIQTEDLTTFEKQASALIGYLRKTHDFKFVLGAVKNAEEIIRFAGKIKFDFIRCGHNIIQELQKLSLPADEKNQSKSQLEMIKSNKVRFIADDIEDATTLTDIISLGTEYAMGNFIGEPTAHLDNVTNIETFEIG